METDDVLLALKRLDPITWKKVYYKHRENFISWSCYIFDLAREDARDIYQDIMLDLFLQLQAGKIPNLTSTMESFLFGIGKRIIINGLRKKKSHSGYCRDELYAGEPYTGSEPLTLPGPSSFLFSKAAWAVIFFAGFF
jgi:DNA-directed RNA polymerase specialized sigma24 family protein